MLGGNLPGNYPIIDKVVAGSGPVAQEITSIKSLDLLAGSYQGGNAVLNTLTRYVDALAGATSRTWAGVTTTIGPTTSRVLEVAIPASGATQAQLNQLSSAAAYAAQQNITLTIRAIK